MSVIFEGTGEKIPYPQMPVYTAHSDGGAVDKSITFESADSTQDLTIDVGSVASDSVVKINGTTYYAAAKVDQLIANLKSYCDSTFTRK